MLAINAYVEKSKKNVSLVKTEHGTLGLWYPLCYTQHAFLTELTLALLVPLRFRILTYSCFIDFS